jgi:hypothetical protein
MKLCTRLGIVAAALLFAGCGATKDSGPEELDPGVDPDGGGGDGFTPEFDVSLDANTEASGDTSCASTSAAAIKPPVDVIIVIDQSGSMTGEIANVKANINKFSDYLKKTGLNYRVVMIASPGSGSLDVCVPPPLGGSTCGAPNGTLFKQVPQHVESYDALKLTVNTYDASPGPWSDMLRMTAVKVFVPITDDNSNYSGTSTYYGISATAFDDQIILKGKGQFGTKTKRNYVVYPIIGAAAYPDEVNKCGTGMVNNGPEYITLAKLTKGKWFPLCESDFGPLFVDMAKSIATRVACELTIPPAPTGEKLDPNRVNVTYTPGGGGSPTTVPRDDSAECLAGANGWQFNADKTKILLCGDACKKVQADLGAKVDVQFGCATVTK